MTNPPPPQPPIPAPQPAPQYTPPQTSGLAIASLVCSLTGVSLLAVIFGHIALGKIRRSNGAVDGRGLTLAGTIVGYVGFALFIATIIFTVIIPLVLVGGVVTAGVAATADYAGNITQTDEELRSINDALTKYSERAGHFPSEDQAIKALVTEPTTAPLPKNWEASFTTLPLDAWGHEFVYRLPEDPTPEDPLNRPRPEVISMGSDGVIGTYDDQSTEELLP